MLTSKLSRYLPAAVSAAVLMIQPQFASAHPAPFTIEDVMQAPYPSDLVAAAAGNAIAWVYDTKGCRNIWIAQDGKARQLTSYTQDDGFDIADLAWSEDAARLAFVRGGSLEDDLPANVDNSPEGATPREVWMVSTAGGAPRKLGTGDSPNFSPDGSRMVFLDKGRIWTVASNAEAAVPLIVDAGRIATTVFSPDGKRLAFVSARKEHSLVGVYEFATKAITWLSPSLDHDGSPAFSPDGARIAFIRIPSEKNPEFVSHRAGQPWSIWVADAASGAGRRVWVADAGVGSAFQPTLSVRNLLWNARDELVFPWEKTGWLQLYAIPVRGGAIRSITTGQFEVVHMAMSFDRHRLVYSSNQDIDRMHVWSVEFQGGSPAPVSKSRAIEDYPQISGDGTVFALQSDATKPLQPVELMSGGRWQMLVPGAAASFPSARLTTPQAITFSARDGQVSHAQLFLPHDVGAAKPHPAIMFFHGGPRRQMLLGFNPMGAYNWMYALNQYFVGEGFIVISVNYRGGIGYGLDYREARDFGPAGGSEVNDLLGAVTYLQDRKDVDPHKIGIWGASYGGLMTALGLARDSKDIAVGVDYAGVYNWDTMLASIGVPVDPGDATRRAFESSPVATIDQWHSPVLVVQSDDDRNVPLQQSLELIEDLRLHHIDHDEIVIPNEIHDLARYSAWIALFKETDEYLNRHLQQPDRGG
ncbi:MAG TPA: prolyl oligopeptidase family serine peptidase [Steroidobacteraceae bacterium]|jgi:dipeptidyl aminopeptidase/acylaminoacyl peptidase|nr:prolyl oligopeptidase family serine peptidase [Steroidobacteraceae bacterium]